MSYLPFTRPTLDEETIQGVVEVLRSGWLATGPNVKKLEESLSAYVGGRPALSFTSATAALEAALQACGIGTGDEVILPALSFVATANVVVRVGAKPVFVDVELDTRNIAVEKIEAAITARTKAIMPVHFSGLAADCDALNALAKKHKLRVIEDAAHAIGSAYKGRKIGSFGDIVCFSFHPNKNMTTIEGGALVSDDAQVLHMAQLQRFHGIEKDASGHMDVLLAGGKSNLSDVAARLGLGQLKRLDEFNAKRRTLVSQYFDLMRTDPPMHLPARGDEGHSWHMFAPLLPLDLVGLTRQDFIARMHEREIGVGIHYPAMHLFTAYRELGYKAGDFPVAERIGRETVTLPLFPAMETADVARVCAAAAEILGQAKHR
ncbi:MAG: DegT/DnrJ/EryC1/StrS family aminotransferase [Burkholderiales bacterium]